ncbi:hypothetical protein [Nocardioides massiliensis]|uniref:Uncharacterized protein n=1 Tax=Nocardioides massiliensis TaxID=1325935 RepID=A0ABT9NLI3_9ACTN|nr:hypothetical protein [Nocardioides massiliensis]MDP9821069.1 hypothetical protein [Nocardioides massiliensis]
MATQLLQHEDAEDFERVYDGFVFGDRPEWWARPECVWVFRSIGSSPPGGFWAADLDKAVDLLWAYHYDIPDLTVEPEWKATPLEDRWRAGEKHWGPWRTERDRLSRPGQVRGFREQLFRHLPRRPQEGVFKFRALPATVMALDRYEAVRVARQRVADEEEQASRWWAELRGVLVAYLAVVNKDANDSLFALLVDGPAGPCRLQVPKAEVKRLVADTPLALPIREAYAMVEAQGYKPWSGRPDKKGSKFLRPLGWSSLRPARQEELRSAPLKQGPAEARLTALYVAYLQTRDQVKGLSSAADMLVAEVAEAHVDRYEDDRALALAVFEPASAYFLGVSLEEARKAASRTGVTPYALLDLVRLQGSSHE